LSLISDTATV